MADSSDTAKTVDIPASTKKKAKRRRKTKRKAPTKAKADASRSGSTAPFPRTTLEESLSLGNAIQQHASGQKVRRTTLFEKLDKSPDSGPSRGLVTNSGKYGITTGGYQAEFLELTAEGAKATDPETGDAERLRARFQLAIQGVPAFSHLYDNLKGKRIPSPEVMRDLLGDVGIADPHRKEAVDLFLENAKFLGLLRTTAGAERLAPIEQVLEETPLAGNDPSSTSPSLIRSNSSSIAESGRTVPYNKVCFVIAPISEEGSEQRKHSDMVLEALIERALEAGDLTVVRADKISDPGMISGQVINYLLKSKLVIADLSFHNPNVFYELAIRHMVGLPTVHLIRREDRIPFDVKDFRTLVIDTSDKYDLIAKLETYRSEIANHARMVTANGAESSNPIRTYAKNLVVKVD
ncbi:MAG: hypothetical protein JWM95_2951 [Gemmatimonadetes bacterium]|nr:hypothetical protein [Gemmatimonadota bacterium]